MKDIKCSQLLLKAFYKRHLEITKKNNELLKEALKRDTTAYSVPIRMKLMPAETLDELENLVKHDNIVSIIGHFIIYISIIRNSYLRLLLFFQVNISK